MSQSKTSHQRRAGIAYLLALVLLVVFAAVGLALSAAANLSLQTSNNYDNAATARLQAEGGMSYMLYELKALRLPGTTTQATFPANLLGVLALRMDPMPNLNGQHTHISGSYVVVPGIGTEDGHFTSKFNWVAANRGRLTVQGTARDVSRRVSVELVFTPKRPAVFDYGLASKGQINIGGHARILGVNNPGEASVLSATQNHSDAISLSGNITVSGDLYAAGSSTYVAMTGTPSVAGSTDPTVIAEHVHLGVDPPDFPETNTAPLAALANGDVITTDKPSQSTFTNVRIAAGTNPTFGGDVTFNGIVYIEAPNKVKFSGQTTINGLIVTQNSGCSLDSCQISFTGGVTANGVGVLPNTSQFADVKQQTGTFICAPGFALSFSGNFGAVNGSIAADQLTFAGTAEGTVEGSVIGLKDVPTSLNGNVDINVDRSKSNENPAGFVKSVALVPEADSYLELTGIEP